jgi:sec-independent protein translocase protein TatC
MALVPFPSARPGDDDPEYEESGSKMSFLEHLDELRKRLIYICWSLLAGCIIAYLFIQKIVDFIMKPMYTLLAQQPNGGSKLIFTSGPEPFMLWVKIGFIAGVFFSSPLIIYQIWKCRPSSSCSAACSRITSRFRGRGSSSPASATIT